MRPTREKRHGPLALCRAPRRDRGAGLIEVAGTVVVVAAVAVAAVAVAVINVAPGKASDLYDDAVGSISAAIEGEPSQPRKTPDDDIVCVRAPCP